MPMGNSRLVYQAAVATSLEERQVLTDAPDPVKENGTRERARSTGGSSESTNFCGGCCNLRRAILGSLGALWWNWKRGNGEERGGYL
jgi:hypothetical protein